MNTTHVMLAAGIWKTADVVSGPIPTWLVAGIIWLLLGLILVCFGLLFVLEAVTYFARQSPITFYVRSWEATHFVIAIVIGLALVAAAGAAFTHFVLDR